MDNIVTEGKPVCEKEFFFSRDWDAEKKLAEQASRRKPSKTNGKTLFLLGFFFSHDRRTEAQDIIFSAEYFFRRTPYMSVRLYV